MKSLAFASVVACFLLSIETVHGFGFGALGGGGGCGCGAPPPPPCLPQLPPLSLPCPPPPPCLPPISLPQISLPCPPPISLPSPCGCGRKKRDAETEVSSDRLLCTSEKLRQLLLENISASATESKINIQKAAVSKLPGSFEVICDKVDFDLVVKSKEFCQESAHDVTCYIYRPL